MIDEKKLIKLLEELRDHAANTMGQCELGTVEHFSYMAETSAYNTAISIIKDTPKVDDWIPCSERLPEDDIDVLATVDGGRYIAVYIFHTKDGEWIGFDGFVVDAAKVTAWQPLPESWGGEE